ncbi:MAG: hypothetical protein A2X67_08590 [Ignavibacteria bacterium GWA2_55_11]|nr:MAG: hypothetical protein A2X67_08590 [Ignavibacteria bacterium GWA2_55_11]
MKLALAGRIFGEIRGNYNLVAVSVLPVSFKLTAADGQPVLMRVRYAQILRQDAHLEKMEMLLTVLAGALLPLKTGT